MLRRAIFNNVRALRARPVAARTSAVLRAQQRAAAVAPVRTGVRWYSDEAKKEEGKEEKNAEAKEEVKEEAKEEAKEENPELAELKKKLEAKDKEAVELKDKYLRTLAEFRTLQDRAARDQKAASAFAIQKFAKDLLDTVDNLDRALATVPPELLAKPEVESEHHTHLTALFDGLKMTGEILLSTMKQHGVEKVEAEVGGKYDAVAQEVTVAVPQADKEEGTVMAVESKGYTLNGRLLRPAKVVVSKKA